MKFKNLLPYRNYQLRSDLPVDEILHNLSVELNIPQGQIIKSSVFGDGQFHGAVTGNNFRMVRRPVAANFFIPVVTGVVNPLDSTSILKIKMKMHPFYVFFLTVVFAMCFFSLLATGFSFRNLSLYWENFYIPLGIVIFSLLSFFIEVKNAQKFLSCLVKKQ